MNRPDEPLKIQEHKDRFYGGKALCILGGPSGKDWINVRNNIGPDVILTCNGNTDTPADYWMMAENMHFWNETRGQDPRAEDFMRMVNAPNAADFRLIGHRSWNLVYNHENAIKIRRRGWNEQDNISLREYGEGFFYGPLFTRLECINFSASFHVGTVACHMMHMAGILGCSEVHTIGMDFKFGEKQHWYDHPDWQPDRFRTEKMFTEYEGVSTMWEWIEGAEWLKSIEWLFERDGLKWRDHSHGLLEVMGLECAK